ncbi:DUF86 domain-containing protein [Candidatus Peregrinibacteria bacterium]|nr:DUF86 domain-containing protein [Candidatus Peregrinibacteria bacterium]
MISKKNVRVYIQDIREAIEKIQEYTSIGKRAFLSDHKTQDAVIYNIAIVGEAVKRLPKSLTSKYPEVEWAKAAKMRDILVHDYSETDMGTVWDTVTNNLPPLKETVMVMLKHLKN